MVKNVSIQNFKSIKDLTFSAKRVNVFIGEPNAGKSNLLEALSLFGLAGILTLPSIVRHERVHDLFFDNDVKKPITIDADEEHLTIHYTKKELTLTVKVDAESHSFAFTILPNGKLEKSLPVEFAESEILEPMVRYKPYYFRVYSPSLYEIPYSFFSPPFGTNLLEVLTENNNLRELVTDLLNEKGYKLNLDPSREEINMIKEAHGVLYTYPYRLLSDTLQRVIFYMAALESNTDSVLLFEEPEANTFPYYTKYLAERIALDENNNQFFIATHNPYLLASMVEKTAISDIAINIAFMRDYQTQLYQLTDDQLAEVLDFGSDVFYNLERFLPQ